MVDLFIDPMDIEVQTIHIALKANRLCVYPLVILQSISVIVLVVWLKALIVHLYFIATYGDPN